MTLWVVDAGPLIFLAKLDRLNLLRHHADEVALPVAVLHELKAQTDEATLKVEKAIESWLQVREVKNRQATELLLADLDLGEAEAIVLAKETKAERVVLDDMDARRAGFPIVGTVGLLLAARLRGEIPSLQVEIERLRQFGFWISEPLVQAVLQEAGE
ncbi:MAG: DUF3368 domain-containing protein [Chloroflexi bacterium]|nr:DUF3368 domain-containing protein [Chloroflexota bacterium]